MREFIFNRMRREIIISHIYSMLYRFNRIVCSWCCLVISKLFVVEKNRYLNCVFSCSYAEKSNQNRPKYVKYSRN